MAKKPKQENKERVSKKEFRKEVTQKLSEALSDFKQQLGEKRFESRLRKVSKLFSRDLMKMNKKNKAQNLEPVSINTETQEAV